MGLEHSGMGRVSVLEAGFGDSFSMDRWTDGWNGWMMNESVMKYQLKPFYCMQ